MQRWSESKVNTGELWDGLKLTEGPKTGPDTDILDLKHVAQTRLIIVFVCGIPSQVHFKRLKLFVYLSTSKLQNQFCRSCDNATFHMVTLKFYSYLFKPNVTFKLQLKSRANKRNSYHVELKSMFSISSHHAVVGSPHAFLIGHTSCSFVHWLVFS